MARDDSTDLLMVFHCKSGRWIKGGSTTVLTPQDSVDEQLLRDFAPHNTLEIDRFTFAVGIEDEVPAPAKAMSQVADGGKPARRSAGMQFQAWRDGQHVRYGVNLQPVSVTRTIDPASSELLQCCINNVSFDSAALIKRKAAGGAAAGQVYVRLDFYGVLISKVEWTGQDEVTETSSFICRSVIMNYRPQLNDGTLGAIIQRSWSRRSNEGSSP